MRKLRAEKGAHMEKNVRVNVIIFGRVQGVFFRDETRRAAQRIGVAGWVRNLPDGTVEALFEGDAEAVNAVIEWCHNGSPLATVSNVQVAWQPWVGDMDGFRIRR